MLESISLEGRRKNWRERDCSGLVLIGYTLCYLIYVAFGGLIFLAIENGSDDSTHSKLNSAKANVLNKYPNISGDALDEFLKELSGIGINGLQAVNDTEAKWTYSQSVFFCVTLLTTIGYGHVAPVSQIGKAICMIYTAFGVPFSIMLLAGWVERIMFVTNALQRVTCVCFQNLLKPYSIRLLIFFFTTIFVSTTFLFLPALLFYHLEEPWTYVDALYFCFISLTTVGLGDFVPGRNTEIAFRPAYRIGVAIYLVLGVIAMMFLMALAGQVREHKRERQSKEERDILAEKNVSYGSITDKTVFIHREFLE